MSPPGSQGYQFLDQKKRASGHTTRGFDSFQTKNSTIPFHSIPTIPPIPGVFFGEGEMEWNGMESGRFHAANQDSNSMEWNGIGGIFSGGYIPKNSKRFQKIPKKSKLVK